MSKLGNSWLLQRKKSLDKNMEGSQKWWLWKSTHWGGTVGISTLGKAIKIEVTEYRLQEWKYACCWWAGSSSYLTALTLEWPCVSAFFLPVHILPVILRGQPVSSLSVFGLLLSVQTWQVLDHWFWCLIFHNKLGSFVQSFLCGILLNKIFRYKR